MFHHTLVVPIPSHMHTHTLNLNSASNDTSHSNNIHTYNTLTVVLCNMYAWTTCEHTHTPHPSCLASVKVWGVKGRAQLMMNWPQTWWEWKDFGRSQSLPLVYHLLRRNSLLEAMWTSFIYRTQNWFTGIFTDTTVNLIRHRKGPVSEPSLGTVHNTC